MIAVYGIFGIPGSGKSIHGKLLKKNHPEVIYVSTGAIFRNIREKNKDLEFIAKMDEWDKTRALYPDEVTARELDKYIYERISHGPFKPGEHVFILDGYPRNLNQIAMMEGKYDMKKVAFLYLPQSVGLDRIVNIRNKVEKRKEDSNIIELQNSIAEHEHNIFQMINYYNKILPGENIRYILGTQSIDNIYTELETFFKK
jgi:adenylate kinase family enzyme